MITKPLALSVLLLCACDRADEQPVEAPVVEDATAVESVEAIDAVEESEPAVEVHTWNTAIGLGGGAGGKLGGRRPNTETYAKIEGRGFREVAAEPLSTFSIDVDTAAYSNVRRFLNDGELPPADAVRIEELINYFRYGDAPPDDGPLAVHTELAPCPWQPEHRLLRIAIRTAAIERTTKQPRRFVFLLDVSGSMNDPAKLPLLQRGMVLLANQLDEDDEIAIVTYAGESSIALPSTGGADRIAIRDAIHSLSASGSTNGAGGIRTAYRLAREQFAEGAINRVILATDGDFNVGTTDVDELTALIERERDSGVFLSVLGFGRGNLKDLTMERLAERGNGNYAYIDTIAEARRVLVDQAGATLVTVAKDVKIQVEFNPRHVRSSRLIGYENRMLEARDFNDDRKDAGEVGAGTAVTALYEVVPVSARTRPATDALKYRTVPAEQLPDTAASRTELATVKVRYKAPDGDTSELVARAVGTEATPASADLRFAAAVAGFGMLLRRSPHAGDTTWQTVIETADATRGSDPERAEFLRLAKIAADLVATEPVGR